MNSSIKRSNRNILLVDDELDVLELLKIYLESLRWNVTVVKSPSQAFKCIRNRTFFLIITDIAMPDMDGYEFINELKGRKVLSRIALMTGFGYNPRHTLVKINKKYNYPILFKPFELKKTKIRDIIQNEWDIYHKDIKASTD
jgi:DNA-binding NtrC family response regulator